MFDWPVKNKLRTAWERRRERPDFPVSDAADIVRHFQESYPIMLNGALTRPDDTGLLFRRAGRTLRGGRGGSARLASAVLRETLEALAAKPIPATRAGMTAVGPRHARVWWDESVVDNLDDVLARLEQPHLVLRFYDVTGLDPEGERWHDAFDIDVDLKEAGRTVSFWAGGRTYVVDLGYVYADGRFLRLARTTAADLPRDGAADPDPEGEESVRCALRRCDDMRSRYSRPDATAKEWAAKRADGETRDVEAELVIHMLYRAFLDEGPRALRRAPVLIRRDADALRQEFMRRERGRVRLATRKKPPVFLVARLDAPSGALKRAAERSRSLPVRTETGVGVLAGRLTTERFPWFAGVAAAARDGRTIRPDTVRRVRATATRVEAADEFSIPVVVGYDTGLSRSPMAEPVFEAAEHLREALAGMRSFDALRRRDVHVDGKRESADAARIFGGYEAKRMAKAGVRFTRMALMLEGRMRPGARLKVAGKLVHADAEGNFRLECVLSGRRASIPMRAGASVGGEARSLINVDWEKRPSRERKHVDR